MYSVIERLARANYRTLWGFQDKAVHAFRDGKDLLIKAPTGAGKTLIEEDMLGSIKHCKLATIQNLRLVLGIDTSKPDENVKYALEKLGKSIEVVPLLVHQVPLLSFLVVPPVFLFLYKTRNTITSATLFM